jgi:hypothetical protein
MCCVRLPGMRFTDGALRAADRFLARSVEWNEARAANSVCSLPRLQPNSGLPEFGHSITGRSRINPTSAGGLGRGWFARILMYAPPSSSPASGGGDDVARTRQTMNSRLMLRPLRRVAIITTLATALLTPCNASRAAEERDAALHAAIPAALQKTSIPGIIVKIVAHY